MKVREDMDMVLNAIDPIQFATLIFDHSPNILVEFFTVRFRNFRLPVAGAKDNLVKDLTIGAHLKVRILNDAN
jgi:hypothetical protein